MKYSLAIKYSLFSILLISVMTVIFTVIFINQHNELLESQLKRESSIYVDILESATAEDVLTQRINNVRYNIYYLKNSSLISYAYILRNDGTIISDGIYLGSQVYQVPEDEFQKAAMKTTEKLFQQNDDILDVSAPLMLGNEKLGVIRIGLSKSRLKSEVAAFAKMASYLGGLFILIGSILTHIIIKKISKPLQRLSYLTSEISHGRFGETIDVKSNDEIKTLADSFNRMSDRIEETNASLVMAKDEAEKFNSLKSEFLAQMSHEIRTPINTMLNYSDLAEEEINLSDKPNCKNYFKVMKNAGKRIIRTIDLILNMSEISKGSYQPSFAKFDIADILNQLNLEFAQNAENKNLDLSFHNKAKVTDVFADKYTITQIFQNLIDNAIKYTDSGFVQIELINVDENVITLIKDSGTGISEKFQKEMFDAFRQEEQGYTRKYDGAGLGLALVANYCELNKAVIKVESAKGKGTTFSISLKL